MLGRKEERREQTKFSRNEDVEMGMRDDQVGSHQKWRHQEGGGRKTCWNFPRKQKTKVVWPLPEARTQPHMCEIAKTRGFWEKEQRPTEKRWRDNIQGDMKKYQLTEDMAQDRKYWMTKILAGPVQGDGKERWERWGMGLCDPFGLDHSANDIAYPNLSICGANYFFLELDHSVSQHLTYEIARGKLFRPYARKSKSWCAYLCCYWCHNYAYFYAFHIQRFPLR